MDVTVMYNQETYKLTIDDTSIIESYIQQEDKGVYIKHLLKTGYAVNSCITPITTTCGCCDKIDQLTTAMEPFNSNGNSSRNGQIGEIFASEQFTKRNTQIGYEDTAKIDKSGDAILTINNHSIDKIMVDYKNYDSCVPTEETDKLVRDLKAQNINYGILFSYRSNISKRGCINYDIIDDKLIVFIAPQGFNIIALEMAVQYLKQLHELKVVSLSSKVSDLVIKGIKREIIQIYEHIYEISCHQSQDINTINENLTKVTKMFYGMINNAEKTRRELNLLKENVNDTIKEIHQESSSNIHSYTELNEYMDTYIDKVKDKSYGIRILNLVQGLDIKGYYSDTDKCIHFTPIGKLKLSKSKLTMVFYDRSEGESQYNRNYEIIKNQNFHIQLSDDPKIWEIIERRFNSN